MAATNHQSRLREYNKQIEAAREAYILKTGKSKAYGFKSSEDYKRILRNKKQYIYRRNRRRVLEDIAKGKDDDSWLNSVIIADNEVYHLVLGYNDKVSRAIRESFKVISRQGKSTGRRVAVDITFPEPEGAPENRIYESEVRVDMAFSRMYQMGLARQDKTNNSDSLFITATQVEGKEGFYFIVVGKYDK